MLAGKEGRRNLAFSLPLICALVVGDGKGSLGKGDVFLPRVSLVNAAEVNGRSLLSLSSAVASKWEATGF